MITVIVASLHYSCNLYLVTVLAAALGMSFNIAH